MSIPLKYLYEAEVTNLQFTFASLKAVCDFFYIFRAMQCTKFNVKISTSVGQDQMFLHNVALHSSSTSPTILIYDGAAFVGQSIIELASYQGVPSTMVLTLNWKIEEQGHAR